MAKYVPRPERPESWARRRVVRERIHREQSKKKAQDIGAKYRDHDGVVDRSAADIIIEWGRRAPVAERERDLADATAVAVVT